MSQSTHSPQVLRFGVFDLDLPSGELRKAGARVRLQPRLLQLLLILLERPGTVVTREELRQRLWPADTFVDFDLSLNSALKKLRYALGDVADNPIFIETLPRRGYRFIASVTTISAASSVDAVPNQNRQKLQSVFPAPSSWSAWRSWPMSAKALAIALPLVILLALFAGWIRLSNGGAGRGSIESLAVLPLENLSGDTTQDYFADGMTDQLITDLGQLNYLRVISRTSSMQYRGVRKPLPQIARELHVDAIVEGTIIRSGDKVRIDAQLIRVSDDRHLWAQSFQSDARDVLGLQREVANAIAKQVRSTLLPGDQVRLGIPAPASLDAYELYLRGEYYLNRFTSESLQQAAKYFQQAIEKDSDYAPAYCKLSGCYRILGNMGTLPLRVANMKAKALVGKALEIDPDFGPAHSGKGWGLLLYDLDFASAGAEFKRAVELSPNSPESHQGLSDYYATVGQLQEAVHESERARNLDPLASIVNNDLCRKLTFARRYDEALAQCKANMDLDSNSARSLWIVGDVYAAKGMESEAVSSFLEALKRAGAPPHMIAAAQAGARDGGLKGYWQALVRFTPESMAKGYIGPFDAALGYTYAGDADKAMPWLEEAVKTRSFGITYLGVDPTFDPLRSDPRFVSLLKRMGLPVQFHGQQGDASLRESTH
ncbi:MAG TPA: winged helix-turn-helix domain-containing protein [Terriglobales bacterium]|nr:winged helix-turn-helix domain-containing protein [Terriglobales bacterium]